MTGVEYESFCVKYLKSELYNDIETTQISGDQGVDIIAYKDGEKTAFQCKYYDSPVGNKAIQEVFAGSKYYDCERAIVITNSTFTKSARDLANKLGVELWEDIWPQNPDIFVSDDILSEKIEDEKFNEKLYHSFPFSTVLFFVKETAELNKKYYGNKNVFIDELNSLESNLLLHKQYFGLKTNDEYEGVIIESLNNLLKYDGFKDIFLINWQYIKGDYSFKFSRISDLPININQLNKFICHFNLYSTKYTLTGSVYDSVCFTLILTPRKMIEDYNELFGKYKYYNFIEKNDEFNEKNKIIVDDGMLSKNLFDSLIYELGLYIGYDIKFQFKSNALLPLNIDYLDNIVFLYDAMINNSNGNIILRFVCKLNNRAKYDVAYSEIVKSSCDSLLIFVDMNAVDYRLGMLNTYGERTLHILEYPYLKYSYINSEEFSKKCNVQIENTDYEYLHQNHFIYTQSY